MQTITGKSMRDELRTMMQGLAAEQFRRRHPRASDTAAWRFATEHAEEFREQALDVLALIYADREADQDAKDRVN